MKTEVAISLFFLIVTHILVKRLLEQEQMWAGLDFVCGELIGWLWFAIGGSHVSDRLPRPHHQRRDAEGGEVILIQDQNNDLHG